MAKKNIEFGYGTVTKYAMQDKILTIESKALYAYLCSFAGGKEGAHPSISKICYDLNIDVKRFRKHMKLLIDYDYIEIDKYRYSNTQQFANNHYRILK